MQMPKENKVPSIENVNNIYTASYIHSRGIPTLLKKKSIAYRKKNSNTPK